MNKKRLLWRRLAMLALALLIAGIPMSEASADRGKKHHEQRDYESREMYEHYIHDDDDDDRDNDSVRDIRFFVPGAAGFADGDTVTLTFPKGISVLAGITLQQGEPLIPAQQVFDALQVPYILYPKGTILEGFADGKHFIFRADKRVMYVNGQKKTMPAAATVMADRFFIPWQAAAYVLGYSAYPDAQNKTIEFRTR